jgi:hypothetical protein
MDGMTEQRLYRLARQAARDLLQGLNYGDAAGVDRKLDAIRRYLALVETVPASDLAGEALHRREQLEALAGVTERLTAALRGLREQLAAETETLRSDRRLLEHLLTQPVPGRRSRAAGCISPAAPTG